MKKIVMIGVRHHVDDDRIYHKESLSLKSKGYKITIIGMPKITSGELNVDRIIEVNGSIFRRIVQAILFGIREQADVYHVHDMESLIAGIFIKIIRPKSKLIWDVHEYYPDMIPLSNFLGKLFLSLMCFIIEPIVSKYLIKLIITADKATAKRYLKWNNKVFVVHNYVEFDNSSIFDLNLVESIATPPVFVYVGSISIDRGSNVLYMLADIISNFGGSLVLVGPIKDRASKDILQKKKKNLIYLGQLPHEQIPAVLKYSDVGVIPLKPIPKYHKNIPIKLFEYLAFGLPILSSRLKATCEFIIGDKVGECIEYDNLSDVHRAIFKILSGYVEYQKNCLRASKKYSWKVAKHTLLKAYNMG